MVFMSKRREYCPPYPAAFRRDAVELVRSSGRPVRELATELGVSYESLRIWCKQAEIDAGDRDGPVGVGRPVAPAAAVAAKLTRDRRRSTAETGRDPPCRLARRDAA